ncbi:AAA family ATPase [Mesorhizobium sp. BAC0120]|uniref:AAA family ATPase n=1 Tax=Mesorhizobium sp. BAC0120 TaxID=3090670 RepID=UPI00298C2158|nr:AAA family ATPase [Mesorhizobium sp. BAC0120]MDW6020643.1 AAA family ATPase [Mesorhizobium sp. BAC0120]
MEGDIGILVGPNGGGKTNLLDALMISMRRHITPPVYEQHSPTEEEPNRYFFADNEAVNRLVLERHAKAKGEDQQVIIIQLEATPTDVANMATMKSEVKVVMAGERYRFEGGAIADAVNWDLAVIRPGDRISLMISNGAVVTSTPAEQLYLSYLHAFEQDSLARRLNGKKDLQTPLLYLPVTRSASEVTSQVSLAGINASDLRRQTDVMSSRNPGEISARAIATIAQRHRILEQEYGRAALEKLKEEDNMMRLSQALRELGYDWGVECLNPDTNTYTIKLQKQGSDFLISSASSGERQLLTYLLSIYALNVRDALIVIDEPELHLHPRWQRSLLRLFEKLAVDTGNQFLMATHSPTFISPTSVQYVSRVYSEAQESRIVGLNPGGLPSIKHQFEAINSQNNERIFFADLVVLVEGPSDRMVIERLLAEREAAGASGATVEVVAVHGKMMFAHYATLLDACRVRHVLVADLDYVQQIGDDDIKGLLRLNARKIKDAIGDPSSIDGETIVRMIEDSIAAGRWVGSPEEWERIKAYRTKLGQNLSEQEQGRLEAFIGSQRQKGIYILRRGALEAYLPAGYGRKDIDKLIELVNAPDFEARLPEPNRNELLGIADAIEALRQEISNNGVRVSEPPAPK